MSLVTRETGSSGQVVMEDDKDLLSRFSLRGQCGLPFGLWHADPF